MSGVYEDLKARAKRLIDTEVSIPALDWAKEAHAIKYQARKACACGWITRDQMIELTNIIVEE